MKLYSEKYSLQVGNTTGYAGYRNRRRLQLFSQRIPVTKNDVLLEIGPNNCLLLDAWKQKAASVTGIELNAEIVQRLARPDLLCMDAGNMRFNDASFTIVVAIEVLEHIPHLQRVFSEIDRVLVPGGKCYLTVPFELFRGQQALGDAWFVYKNLSMARQLHVHKLNPQRIKQEIKSTGLTLIFSKLIWIPGPSYFIVLQKGTGS